jgi:hypothetical protein
MNVEYEAASRLLNNGVEVPLSAPLLFRLFGKRNTLIIVRAPFYGTLARITRLYVKNRLSKEQLDAIEDADFHELFLTHHKAISKIAAYAWLNNPVCGFLLAGIVAWWFRWHMDDVKMHSLIKIIAALTRRKDFTDTIILVDTMRVTSPNLSQSTQGS